MFSYHGDMGMFGCLDAWILWILWALWAWAWAWASIGIWSVWIFCFLWFGEMGFEGLGRCGVGLCVRILHI